VDVFSEKSKEKCVYAVKVYIGLKPCSVSWTSFSVFNWPRKC